MKKQEICTKSMELIESRFSQLISENIWVPDWHLPYNNSLQTSTNALVMGRFIQTIFQLQYWPNEDFRIYCLSHAVKNTLTKLLGFDDESVSIIPRYNLFKSNSNLIEFPETDFTLVHSGRISPQKNIEFIIFIAFYFQIFLSPKINLLLMGNFDNEYHHNLLNIKTCDYEYKINHLINSLPWVGEKPTIITNLGSNQWCSEVPSKSLIFSASNLIYEDFSVSVAQAQEEGFPCLLPYWGGFKDVTGPNVQFFDSKLIGTSNESFQALSLKAQIFVKAYLSNTLFRSSESQSLPQTLQYPAYINRAYLEKRINDNIKRWGSEIEYITKGQFHLFVKSQNGVKFLHEYNCAFSDSNNSRI